MNSIIKKIDSGYNLLVKGASYLQSVFVLVVRLYWGWQFFVTGTGKFKNLPDVANFFSSLGIPFPMVNATVVATVETLGGILLIAGLASRLAALPLTVTLIVAYATADRDSLFTALTDNSDEFLKSTPLTFLFASLIVLAFGPGVFSLDYLIKRFVFKKTSSAGHDDSHLASPHPGVV